MNERRSIVHIGIDDIDSPLGGCTTHAALYLTHKLLREFEGKLKLIEPLNLVRLNPSIPWKTRGNGAVCIRIEIDGVKLSTLSELVSKFIERYSRRFTHVSQSPGAIIIDDYTLEKHFTFLKRVFELAVSDLLHKDFLEPILNDALIVAEGRGIIGSLAAIAWITTRSSYTYELLTYRGRSHWGLSRCIDPVSVIEFDSVSKRTLCNVDNDRILIAPHGNDPVLYGVRGLDPFELLEALKRIHLCEDLAGFSLFVTNQHTNDHLRYSTSKDLKRAYRCGCVLGYVLEVRYSRGALLLTVCDSTGCIDAVAFTETRLNKVIQGLNKNDLVRVCGCVKPWKGSLYIHVERIDILELYPAIEPRRPRCPRCNSKVKYVGRGSGFKCFNCGYTFHSSHFVESSRALDHGMYLPPTSRIKHLQKPLLAYLENPTPLSRAPIAMECYEPLDFL